MAYIGVTFKSLTFVQKPRFAKWVLLNAIAFAIVSLTVAIAQSSPNLVPQSPRTTRIQGNTFPRNDKILYRGTHEAQYSYVRAARAMLGDENSNLESPMLATIKDALMKRYPHLLRKIAGLQAEFDAYRVQYYIDLKLAVQPLGYSETAAFETAVEIMSQIYSDDYARTRIYDYRSSYLELFPKSYLYSTVYIEVAKVYSSNIVVFKENKPRSLDANYWNKVTHGRWVFTNLPYPDLGEFVSAYYISAGDIIGYQNERSYYPNTVWNVWSPLTEDLGLVLMKRIINKTPYVYAFDATGLQNVEEVDGEFCASYSQFDTRAEIPLYTQPDCSKKPRLVSILRTCSAKETKAGCRVPVELYRPYRDSNKYQDYLPAILKTETISNDSKIISMTQNEARLAENAEKEKP